MSSRVRWGPFGGDMPWDERKARLRCLRLAVRLLTGPRGKAAELALLRSEISGGDADLLDEASAEFDRLPSLDRRKVLASFAATLIPGKVAS